MMPTEEQMAQSLLEAKDVTIEELRRERDALIDERDNALSSAELYLNWFNAACERTVVHPGACAILCSICLAIGLLLGVGLHG